ncbi:MAG: hypothetical protein WBR26_09345 [Candidatus Acidiferrum sp.]
MSTPSNAMPESSFEPLGVAPMTPAETRPMYWSIRRELWENRWVYIAPLAAAGVFLIVFLISTVGLPRKMRALSAFDLAHQQQALVEPYDVAAGLIMGVALLVGIFYSLDALYGERRDRSILFWKSLPVSDRTTVLSKACVPLVIVPLLSFALTFATQLVMLLWSSVVLLGSGQSVATLWSHVAFAQTSVGLLYHLVTVHSLWYAPIFGWLLLISAWARRAPFLWAAIPPVAIAAAEKMMFNTSHFANFLGYRFAGPESFTFPAKMSMPMHTTMSLDLLKFLSTPGLWLGLLAAGIFLALAIRLRRYHDPI